MFIYEMFTSTPTSVMNIIFTPCNSVESNMRLIESSLPYKKMLLTKKIETFSDKMVRYYQKKEKYLNIMLLGGNGVGKSSFVKELSKIICKTPIKPQIGNHSSYQMSTTTR